MRVSDLSETPALSTLRVSVQGMRLVSALCAALLLGAVLPGAVLPSAATAPSPASVTAPDCDPELIELPQLAGTITSFVYAMNDEGWVVAVADMEGTKDDHLVLWRNGRPPLDMGRASWRLKPGERKTRIPVDINAHGVILMRTLTQHYRGMTRGWRTVWNGGVLWHRGAWTPLTGTTKLPWVEPAAVNDRGVAVGTLRSAPRNQRAVPVVWRHGTLERLPMAPGATGASASDINNHGLVVGSMGGRSGGYWWWRLDGGDGRFHPLAPHEHVSGGMLLDDRGRAVASGYHGGAVWDGRKDRPRWFDDPGRVVAMSAQGGYVLGWSDEGTDSESTTWLRRLVDPQAAATVPDSPDWDFSSAWLVGTGVTAYAPDGGVTLVGAVGTRSDGPGLRYPDQHAALWTCAQTYLD
jgi:uncharacterized membrane protein